MASLVTSLTAGRSRSMRLPWRVRSLVSDPVGVALAAVFAVGTAFYIWRTTFAAPLALYGGQSSPYNQLADAFLHLHLWVVHVPAQALGPGNPYNPAERSPFLFAYPDYALYGHYLYITWGPGAVLVWLLPLHVLGFEPSASVIMTPFVVSGFAFSLATLRVIVRRIGRVRLWMCILAALTLLCASVIPYVVRFPFVYQEEIASGYCFVMAGVWLGVSGVDARRASLKRLALMSLCLGLATACRPTLGLTGLLLVAVYASLRLTRPRRGLLVALATPFAVCVLLLAAYNQARFGNPLQYGAKYQINGPTTYHAHFGELSFLAPGLWAYLFAPPRLSAIFPFTLINYPEVSYPLTLPAHYSHSEETGGLLVMAPIAIFLVALPWMWRRRPSLLGSLTPLLLVMVGVGFACMAFVAYEIYISTERYEADYMTLLLFGALAAWLALSSVAKGRWRRLVRTGGGVLAVWSCATGMATSYQEIEKYNAGAWRMLVDLGTPLSTAITAVAGHPVIAEVFTPNILRSAPGYGNIGTEVTGFWLTARNQVDITIVSPDSQEGVLASNTVVGPALEVGGSLEISIGASGRAGRVYRLPGGARMRIPVHLSRGVNQLTLRPVTGEGHPVTWEPGTESEALMVFTGLTFAAR